MHLLPIRIVMLKRSIIFVYLCISTVKECSQIYEAASYRRTGIVK